MNAVPARPMSCLLHRFLRAGLLFCSIGLSVAEAGDSRNRVCSSGWYAIKSPGKSIIELAPPPNFETNRDQLRASWGTHSNFPPNKGETNAKDEPDTLVWWVGKTLARTGFAGLVPTVES